ncbi:MAG: Mu-like prophage major head subunit gpT family protein, partial [Planctomyces sp.]
MPGMREWLGERQFSELRAANFVLENKHWESSLLIKKTDLADDNLGQYGPVLEQLGIEAAHHPDELWFSVLEQGESTACFDGQFFFDTDHVWG